MPTKLVCANIEVFRLRQEKIKTNMRRSRVFITLGRNRNFTKKCTATATTLGIINSFPSEISLLNGFDVDLFTY